MNKQLDELAKAMDEIRKTQTEKKQSKEEYDKVLDQIILKRKKDYDERDKLYKSRNEMKDKYYQQLIDYTKQQRLIDDIKWMEGVKQKLQQRKEEKEKRDQERKERYERIQKEKEERKRQEEERKQKELERK